MLREPQTETARRARVPQGSLSAIESRGRMPKTWRIDQIAAGYRLSRERFIEMVRTTQNLLALQRPAADEFPLGQHAQGAAGEVLALPQTSAPEAGKAVQA